jgi:hypothetical protein
MGHAHLEIGKEDPLLCKGDESEEDICGPRQQETVPDDEGSIAFPEDKGNNNGKGAEPVFPDRVYPVFNDAQLLLITSMDRGPGPTNLLLRVTIIVPVCNYKKG